MSEVTQFAEGVVSTRNTKLINPPPGTINDLDLSGLPPLLGDQAEDRVGRTLVQLAQECDEWVAVSLRRLGWGNLTPTSKEISKMVSNGYAFLLYSGGEPFLEPTQKLAG